MNSLFSHGETATPTGAPADPPVAITAEVTVPRNPDDSFVGFTDGIHLWWPADQTSFGDGTHPEFTDGDLFEEDPSGRIALWATVQGLATEGSLELAWHYGGNPNFSSHVAISFTPHGTGTQVRVVHDGWAAGGHGHEQLAAAPDWPVVLACYQRFMGGAA